MMPPPFPLTPFVLTCGALEVSRTRFFVTLGIVRAVRFGIEAALAVIYGRRILGWMRSDLFQTIVIGFAIVAVVVTIAGIVDADSPEPSCRARCPADGVTGASHPAVIVRR